MSLPLNHSEVKQTCSEALNKIFTKSLTGQFRDLKKLHAILKQETIDKINPDSHSGDFLKDIYIWKVDLQNG